MYEFSGGHIQSCIIRAAARAALNQTEANRKITMQLLSEAAHEEKEKQKHNISMSGKSMYM